MYPTIPLPPDKETGHLMPLPGPAVRTAARASAFWHDRFLSHDCNIFAPFCRQVGMNALYVRRTRFDHVSTTSVMPASTI